jgi:exosome complex RNA-binding protein Rrp42 (RNase PH superfamily)
MEIEKYIEKVIKGSKALDTESLCILSGKNVWAIDVNVVLINHDGNLTDAMHLCSLLSLLHFRRP